MLTAEIKVNNTTVGLLLCVQMGARSPTKRIYKVTYTDIENSTYKEDSVEHERPDGALVLIKKAIGQLERK